MTQGSSNLSYVYVHVIFTLIGHVKPKENIDILHGICQIQIQRLFDSKEGM